jgi:hypothetical protein
MQLTNPPQAEEFHKIVKALHSQRLVRYFSAANKDDQKAFSFYLWNCALCEAFHLAGMLSIRPFWREAIPLGSKNEPFAAFSMIGLSEN